MTNRLLEQSEVNSKEGILFGVTIAELLQERKFVDTINSYEKYATFLNTVNDKPLYRTCFNEDPKAFLFNLIICAINHGRELTPFLNSLFTDLDFDSIYGDDTDWQQRAIFWANKLTKGKKTGGGKILRLPLLNDLKRIIPLEALRTSRIRTTHLELSIILKTITNKIYKRHKEKGKACCYLSRNYFTCERFRETFYEKTKRRLDKNRISFILSLLEQYQFIVKTSRYDRETKRRLSNRYEMGAANFYHNKFKNSAE